MKPWVAALGLLACASAIAGENRQEAIEHSSEGTKLYNIGEYQQALDHFKSGYLAKPSPMFLFNMAQCYRMLGQHEAAARQYRAYLREEPGAANRAAVEQFIAT